MWIWTAVACLWLLPATWGAERKFELRGEIQPAPPVFTNVTLHGADFPFDARTLSDGKGRFRFKKLDPGQYVVIVFLPGGGEVRRTVAVSPGVADRKGRVTLAIPFEPGGESIEESGTVSFQQFAVPDEAKREYSQAQKRLNRRDVEGAIRHLERAVEIAPSFVAAWNNLGTIAYQTGRYADAERYFRSALRYEPDNYSPLVNLGGTLLSLQRYLDALPYNEQAVELRPDEALAHSQLGLNWFMLGEDEKALRHLREARRIDPNHFSHPQITLARIHINRGETADATRELEDFIERHPDSPNAKTARRWLEMLRSGDSGPAR